MAGRFAAAERGGEALSPPPATTAMGALLAHITGGAAADTFQPMNVNFGLFPPLEPEPGGKRRLRGRERKRAYSERALKDIDRWLAAAAVAA
jgi:methylenetetrahydrofolate--tRNA-(uracil-5-)-methyltransferase